MESCGVHTLFEDMLWICKASKLGALTHNKHVQTPQNPPWKDSETTEQSKTNGESSMTLRRFHPTHPQHIGVVFRGECMYAIHGVYMSVWDGYFLTLLVVNPHGANWAFLVEASGGTRCHLEATDRPHNWTWCTDRPIWTPISRGKRSHGT